MNDINKDNPEQKGGIKAGLTALLPRLGISDALFRLLLAWLAVSSFFIIKSKSTFVQPKFFKDISLTVFVIAVAVLWIALCYIPRKNPIRIAMIAAACTYALLGVYYVSGFPFAVGCCAAVGIIIMLTDLSGIHFDVHRSVPWIAAGILMTALTVFVGWVCCLYYQNHWTSCYDFGLFSQMFHYMKETGMPLVTCERDTLLTHFAVHFSPIYYLLLPIYIILPDPRTLLVMQVLIVASGAIPLILICKNHKLNNLTCCAFTVIYTLYPCFAGGCFTYIHENNFLAPLVLWLICFCEKEKTVFMFVFAVLLLLVKEDAAVYTSVIALYFTLTCKKKKTCICILLLSVVYFVIVTHILAAYGDGVMTYRYKNFIYDDSRSLMTIISAVIKNPIYVLEQCFDEDKLIFILKMMLPLGFLPFITKEPRRLILFIPFILINLMSNYKWQADTGFQYNFGSGSLLLYLAVINYSELKNPKLLLSSVCSSAIIFCSLYHGRLDYFKAYRDAAESRQIIDEALSVIPDNATVIASTFMLPNLSQRDEVYELEHTNHICEYYVLDLRYETEEFKLKDYLGDEFEVLRYKENVIAVIRRREY